MAEPIPVPPPPPLAAPPAPLNSRRWLVLGIAAGAVFVLLVAVVVGWFVVVRPFDERTRVTLTAAMPDGSPPTEQALERAAGVLTDRFETAGLTDPQVRVDGDRLVVSYRDEVDQAQLEGLIGIGELQFRKVLESTADDGGCAGLDPPAGPVPAGQPQVVCDETSRYELAAAALTERDVDAATADLDPVIGDWQVLLEFTAEGQTRWTELTRDAATNASGECRTVGSSGACQIVILLDGEVLMAPEVTDVIVGPAQLSGQFSRDQAFLLAAQLSHGSQPLVLEVESVEI